MTHPNSQQQQELAINDNSNNIGEISSQSMSLTSSESSISTDSRSSEEKPADKLFDAIEDMLCDYMREPNRHYLHCRVLRWNLEDDESRLFSAVVTINPPTTQN